MRYTKIEKESFVENFKLKTKSFAIDTINFCNNLQPSLATRNVCYQLIRSATSTGANYRAACRGRSKAEFFSKLSITIEEADESQYWLEIIEGLKLNCDNAELKRLKNEITDIVKILTSARKNTK